MSEKEIIIVDSEIVLSKPDTSDIPQFIKYLNDPEIYKFTLAIPHPYAIQDAREFIRIIDGISNAYGRAMHWAIRDRKSNLLIGGIGFHCKYQKGSHREEIGYWLAKAFWGKGIMTKVLKTVCSFGFEKLGLKRIEAPIFDFNVASMRVAEKAGFKKEGIVRKAYLKDEIYIDGVMYALIDSDYENR